MLQGVRFLVLSPAGAVGKQAALDTCDCISVPVELRFSVIAQAQEVVAEPCMEDCKTSLPIVYEDRADDIKRPLRLWQVGS